jgi:WD40 repeat protein
VECLSVSPDGKKLAAGGCDRLIQVWDISAGIPQAKLTDTIENHKRTPKGLQEHLDLEINKWGPVIRKAGAYAD